VKKAEAAQAASPLMFDGMKLTPSVTRVFSKTKDLYVFLQAYEAPLLTSTAIPSTTSAAPPSGSTPPLTPVSTAPAAHPLVSFVTFYRDGKKALETRPQEVSPLPNSRLQVAPLNFSIDLGQLEPGKYDCQVTVLDPTGAKGTFWQAPIMVVQ